MENNFKLNFIFQLLYQLIILIIPLIISPYLTRVLGETNLGVYTYSNSIAYYFVIFGMLGIMKYGQRAIASVKHDKIKLRKCFWSIFIVHAIVSLISLSFYSIFSIFIISEYNKIYIVQIIYVASCLFDITWYFYGLEDMKSIVLRNLIIKILMFVMIFLFVKNSEDLLMYAIIMSISSLLSQIIVWPKILKSLPPIKVTKLEIVEHVKPMFILFISVIAVALYTIFDKTLLGIFSTKENVAYYEYSDKIINIPKIIIATISTVMLPKACKYVALGETSKLKKYTAISLNYTYFVGFGCVFGLIGVSSLFTTLYYGSNFMECGKIVQIMSPLILIVGIGDILRTQYLIPNKKDKEYTICICISAVLNLILSLFLIKQMGIFGALIGTISAELFGLIYQIYLCRKYINPFNILIKAIPYFIAGLFMLIFVSFIKIYYNKTIFDLLLQIFLGAIFYCLIIFIYFFFISHQKQNFKNTIYQFLIKIKPIKLILNYYNTSNKDNKYNKVSSYILKGFAVCVMFWSHMFAHPERLKDNISYVSICNINGIQIEKFISPIFSISVSIFLFISGYAFMLGLSRHKLTFKKLLKRIITILLKYWLVFVTLVPICIYIGSIKFNIFEFIGNFFTIICSYCGEWWFLFIYIILYCLGYCFQKILSNEKNIFKIVFFSFSVLVLSYIIDFLLIHYEMNIIINSWFYDKLKLLMQRQIFFVIGITFYNLNLFGLFEYLLSKVHPILKYFILIFFFIINLIYLFPFIPTILAQTICIPLFILAFIHYVNLLPNKLKVVLSYVGKISVYMWLCHSILLYQLIQSIIFMPKISILCYFWFIVIIIVISSIYYLLEIVFRKVINLFKIKYSSPA